jgi:hypothetical protein
MNKETRTKIILTTTAILFGIFLCLEGLEITNIGTRENNAPSPILMLAGLIFILAGIMIIYGKRSKLNNVLASLLTAIMGIIGGWISLYGDTSNFLGNGMFISHITNLPLERIMFGFGSLICFLVSGYAFRLFLRSKGSI